jgi:hypothetical protein
VVFGFLRLFPVLFSKLFPVLFSKLFPVLFSLSEALFKELQPRFMV